MRNWSIYVIWVMVFIVVLSSGGWKIGVGGGITHALGERTRAESVDLIWMDSQPPKTDPGLITQLSLKVVNTGEHKDSYKLEVLDIPVGWTFTWTGFADTSPDGLYAYTDEIDPDSPSPYTTGILFVTPPANPMAQADTYTFSVKASSMTYGGSMDQENVMVDVNHIPGVKVSDPTSKSGEPGSNVLYTFTVTNTGNGADRFQIKAEANTANGWGALLISSSQTNQVLPGKKVYIQVYHTIPKTALANYSSSLELYATSMTDSDVQDRGHVETKVKHVYGIELGINRSYVEVYPDKVYTFRVYVNNTGNGHDDKVNLKVGYGPYNMNEWNPVIDPDPLKDGILYSGSVTTEFRFKVPISQDEGYYSFTLEAYSGEDGSIYMDGLDVDVYVLPTVGVTVELNPLHVVKYTFTPGHVSYPIKVINTGNTEDTFYLNVTYLSEGLKKDWILFSENNISLAPAEEKDISVTVDVREKVLAKNYTIEISAESLTDIEVGTDKARVYLLVWSEYGVELQINESEAEKTVNPSASSLAQKSVDFECYLRNLGNDPSGQDQFQVKVTGSFAGWEGWSLHYAERVNANPFQTVKEKVTITAPSKVTIGEYEFVVTANSIMDPTKVDSVKLLVKVVQYDFAVSPEVKYDGKTWALYRAEVEKDVIVEVTILNKGNSLVGPGADITSLNVMITTGSGTAQRVIKNETIKSLEPFGSKKIIFNWQMPSEGTYNLTVYVDPENRITEANEENNVLRTPDIEFINPSKSDGKDNAGGFEVSGESIALIVIIVLEAFVTYYLFIMNQRKRMKKKLMEEAYSEKGSEKLELTAEEALEEKGIAVEKETKTRATTRPAYSPYTMGETNPYMGGGYSITPKPTPQPTPIPAPMPMAGMGGMRPAMSRPMPPSGHKRSTIKVVSKTRSVGRPASGPQHAAKGGELQKVLSEAKALTPKSEEKGLKDVLGDIKKTPGATTVRPEEGKKDLKSLLNEIKSS